MTYVKFHMRKVLLSGHDVLSDVCYILCLPCTLYYRLCICEAAHMKCEAAHESNGHRLDNGLRTFFPGLLAHIPHRKGKEFCFLMRCVSVNIVIGVSCKPLMEDTH